MHLLVMPIGQVQPVLGKEIRPAPDYTAARRPGDNLDLCLCAGGKGRCFCQRRLAWADPGLGQCLVLSPPGTKMVAQDVRHSARRPLDLSVLGQDGLGVLALEVTPGDGRYREAFHKNIREVQRFVMHMQSERESSDILESLPLGIHDRGSGRHTPRRRAPTRREHVFAHDALSGACVHHRSHSSGVLVPETQGCFDIEIIPCKTSRVPRQAHGVHAATLVRNRQPHWPSNAAEANTDTQVPGTDGRAPTGALSHLASPSRGTGGYGLFLMMGVLFLRTILVQSLLDALQDRDPVVLRRRWVPPSRGGAFGLAVLPADGLGELDALAG